jgi:hypothetical protein
MILFRTDVVKVPPTPLGLLPEGWSVQHHCRTCRQMVGSDELVGHAQKHDTRDSTRDEPDADWAGDPMNALEKGDTTG